MSVHEWYKFLSDNQTKIQRKETFQPPNWFARNYGKRGIDGFLTKKGVSFAYLDF
jgi:hypothetical protein